MMQIEKEHKQSALMSRKKEDLVEHIMCLEHNNNILHDTITQQAENFKKLLAEEVDYWKREAIKNAAELGEIKIKQKKMKPKDVRGMRNFLNAIYMYRGFCQCGRELTSDFFYCNKCGQKLDWSV